MLPSRLLPLLLVRYADRVHNVQLLVTAVQLVSREGMIVPGPSVWNEIDNLLEESPEGTFLELFSNFSPTDDDSVYNVDCWAASLDFTSRAWYGVDAGDVQLGATFQTGTLVSPRHAIAAEHSNWQAGWKLTWIALDGTSHQREILDIVQVGITDIEVLYLSADLPGTIANAEILPADYQSYLPSMPTMPPVWNENLGGGNFRLRARPPVITTCQHRRASVMEVYKQEELSGDRFVFGVSSYVQSNYSSLYSMSGYRNSYMSEPGIVSGDSGHPLFMLLNGNLILVFCWTGAGGPVVARYIDAVNAVMTTLEDDNGGSDGYQLQEWSPTVESSVSAAQLVDGGLAR